ncbi:hypothetical protein SASPL_116479 [Salvia splendens]|uniref:UBL3-like ubiquitin domain-containing protein n=1 Tax=Salvia splendens TaxID=180675 RepID=A0A8X8XTW9_SALSN|nr:hypothetical protein SASPL_116479 [Salvia splendens]
MAVDGLVELKFRLADGSDIGPSKYSSTTTVTSLKETIISEWPQGWLDLYHGGLKFERARHGWNSYRLSSQPVKLISSHRGFRVPLRVLKTLPFVFFCWCGYLEKDGISRITICAVSWYPSTSFDVADKENGPKSINDIKLINAGKILENDRTLDQSRTPLSEVPGDVITMLVVVQSPLPDKHSGNKLLEYDALISIINCRMNPRIRLDAHARSCNVFGRAKAMSFTNILHEFSFRQ